MQQPQDDKNAGDQDKREDKQTKIIWSVTSTAIPIQIFLIGIFFLWLVIHDYVPDRAEATKVFIESMFSYAIVIVVVVHAVMYYKQAKAMDAQVQQSERAVKAAEKNVETVEKTAIYANRAYVTVAVRKIRNNKIVELVVKNSGHTPANDVIVSYSAGYMKDPPDGLDADFLYHRRLGLIGPSSPYAIGIREDNVSSVVEAGARFYCWGRVQYQDIFEEGRRTYFCFYVKMEGLGYSYGPCENGNYAE